MEKKLEVINNITNKKLKFKKKLKNFINILNKTKIDGYFNPWAEDENNKKSAEQRLSNLKNFLSERMNAKYLLLGEAPSYGARYTGIPMISEKIFNSNPDIFPEDKCKCTSIKADISPVGESTANAVWEIISKCNKDFVMWNAFAFLDKNGKYIENPSKLLIEANREITKAFIDMFDFKILFSFCNSLILFFNSNVLLF